MLAEDLERAEALAVARRRATLVLATMAAVFVSTFFLGDASWVGYLQSTAEAGLIGGLADWFAVVALFRHPLGVPIPHTAIIPTSKDGLGRSMARFVAQNFLEPELVIERLRQADVADRLGGWLRDPENAGRAAARLAHAAGTVWGSSGASLGNEIDTTVIERIEAAPLASLVGRGLEQAVRQGAHRPLVGSGVVGLRRALVDNRKLLRRRLGTESPWWVPESVDDAVFDRAWEIITRLLGEVEADEHHELRRILDERLAEIAVRLQEDEDYGAAFRAGVVELVSRPEVRSLIRSSWGSMAGSMVMDEERLATTLASLGDRLAGDADLRRRLEGWLETAAMPLSIAAGREVEGLISQTIERWDTAEAAGRLELWMGRDLQFVRINGTLVGALIGLLLHTAVHLLT